MRKILYNNIPLACVLMLAFGCATGPERIDRADIEGRVTIENLTAALGNIEPVGQTRAIRDYAVNTDDDPTGTLEGRETWTLHVTIHDAGVPYTYGEADFQYTGSDNIWTPLTDIWFPNYFTQKVAATLTPDAGWSGTIAVDQSTEPVLFAQDLLEQNGDLTINVAPAHQPTIRMRHAHSMLDFILSEVDFTQVDRLWVEADSKEYTPLPIGDADKEEFLLILPTGITKPVVHINTKGGARYQRELDIPSTVANMCYCVTLTGLELLLSAITVSNWIYGEAIAADYSTVTSYPTFKGPPEETVTLHFNNGLTQLLIFNIRGETTVRPGGRTLVGITYNDTYIPVDPPLILNKMSVDLNPYL